MVGRIYPPIDVSVSPTTAIARDYLRGPSFGNDASRLRKAYKVGGTIGGFAPRRRVP
jgi:hypothetical protein